MLHPAIAHYAMPFRFVTEYIDPLSAVRLAASAALIRLLGKVENRLGQGPWWYGGSWSVVDAHLHWIWTQLSLIGFDQNSFAQLTAHTRLSEARPAILRTRKTERRYIAVLQDEGIYKTPV